MPPVIWLSNLVVEPGEELRLPGVVGIGHQPADRRFAAKIEAQHQEGRALELRQQSVVALAGRDLDMQQLALAEEIAMLPEGLAAEAQAGIVVDPGADAARPALGHGDAHGDPAIGAHLVRRGDADGGKEIAGDQRLLRGIDLAAVIALAFLPGETLLDEVAVDRGETADLRLAEARGGTRDEGKGDMHAAVGAIDDRLMTRDLGQRIAARRVVAQQLVLGGEDGGRLRPHAELEAEIGRVEALGQWRHPAAGQDDLDLAQAIGSSQHDLHGDPPRLAPLVDLVGQLGVVVAGRPRGGVQPRNVRRCATLQGEFAIGLALAGNQLRNLLHLVRERRVARHIDLGLIGNAAGGECMGCVCQEHQQGEDCHPPKCHALAP